MKEVSKNLSEMQQRIASKERAQFASTGGEKTSYQSKKNEKFLNDDELYLTIQEELYTRASKMAIDINNAKVIPWQRRRKVAEKPLYLMRYE